jgi:ferric-dicitrate binding protein FerR (iron transport regulator)
MNQQKFSKTQFDRMTAGEKLELFVQGYRLPQKRSKAEALELLHAKIDPEKTQTVVRNFSMYWSAAASVTLIVLLTTVYLYTAPVQVIAGKGQHIENTLPDGSAVSVNAGSKITYSKSGFADNRSLKLEGEAFFLVQKGKPFVVKTRLGTAEVLGTTLNVYARGNEFAVSCLTGRVRVTANSQHVILEPGEKAGLISGTLVRIVNIPTSDMAVWRAGEFHFDNLPLIVIFEEIERQFNVNIIATGIENRFFTGSFSNKNLNEVLETVCLPMKLEYEIRDGDKISIRAKKN